jgi:predicted restriction endonuclease
VGEVSAITTAGLIGRRVAYSDRSAGVFPLALCRFHFETSQPKLAPTPNHHHTTTTPSIKQWQGKHHYDHVTNRLDNRKRSIRFDGVLLWRCASFTSESSQLKLARSPPAPQQHTKPPHHNASPRRTYNVHARKAASAYVSRCRQSANQCI